MPPTPPPSSAYPAADGAVHNGRGPGISAELTQGFYGELRRIAQRVFASERADHTLQPTAVVNEACLRMIAAEGGGASKGRGGALPDVPREQKLALAGRVLRQVLIDHARARNAEKRGGPDRAALQLDLDGDVLAHHATRVDFESIHRALERLRQLSERQAEVVALRIFSGLTMEQVASVLGVSKRSAEGDWTVARAWLRRELAQAAASAPSGRRQPERADEP